MGMSDPDPQTEPFSQIERIGPRGAIPRVAAVKKTRPVMLGARGAEISYDRICMKRPPRYSGFPWDDLVEVVAANP